MERNDFYFISSVFVQNSSIYGDSLSSPFPQFMQMKTFCTQTVNRENSENT